MDYQGSLEKTENKRLQDVLALSYTLSNKYEENRWKYQDAEALLNAVTKKREQQRTAQKFADLMMERTEQAARAEAGSSPDKVASSGLQEEEGKEAEAKPGGQDKKLGELREQSGEGSENSSVGDVRLNTEENVFQHLLGLPEISIETLYMQYKEKDKDIMKLMNEHTNFMQIHEGYPEYLTCLQGGSGGSEMKRFKPCPWSQEAGNLDFYDSLDFINKFYSITQQVQQELYDALKPHDTSLLTYIDTQVAEFAIQDYRKVLQIMEGAIQEYAGRQYFEDESVLGNPEKMVFLAKEMIAELTLTHKHALDPFLVAKLNRSTIHYFHFPQLKKSENKYDSQFLDGCRPADWVVKQQQQIMVQQAQKKAAKAAVNFTSIYAT